MTLTWYGHSCFKIDDGAKSIVFDPYAPGKVPGLALPPLAADLCICSHRHDDHSYAQGVALSGRKPAVIKAQVSTFHDDCGGRARGENTCTVVELGGLRFLHMGDVGHPLSNAQIEKLGHIDVLMVPVGGYYTIDAVQAKKLKDALRPLVTVPMHYRGAGFGYDCIAAVDEFAALCGDAVYVDSNVIEPDKITQKCTVILKCPVK